MSKAQAWVKALRLRTLPLSLAGIIFGSAIAFSQGYINWCIFALAISTTVLFQIVSNLANDYGDGVKGTDNEGRVGPMRAVQSGVITSKEMRNAVIFTSILSAISALALIYVGTIDMASSVMWGYVILAGFCILAAITYTVGKKAYGYNGMGDIMVFIFFGLVSVLGVYSLYAKSFDWLNIFPAITWGLLSTAVLNLNNMRDYHSDKKASKNTLVVKMGLDYAKMYHVLLVLVAIASWFYFLIIHGQVLTFASLLPTIPLFLHVMRIAKAKETRAFDPELKVVSLATFAISIIYFVAIWF